MNLQPTLRADGIALRPLRPDDWDALYAVARDPLIWEQHPAHDRWREPVFRAYFDGALASGGAFAIVDATTVAMIGSSRYADHDPVARTIEIGWTFYARGYWGGPTNRTVKTLMLDHAFGFVDTVLFIVGEHNFRSQAAMRKIGGVERPERLIRDYGHGPVEQIVFEIAKDAWQARG